MGAPDSGMQAAGQESADSLLTALRTIKPGARARHAQVLDYWLSIRGNKEFPPLHDLDPLELSDAGPSSILLELIGGGQDAEIRHLGDSLKEAEDVARIIDAPNPSILACIARKLPIVAISRDFLAFEDSYDTADGWTRCWVTLLPLSSCGSWVDYVYAFVSVETSGGKPAKPVEEAIEEVPPEAVAEEPEAAAEAVEPEMVDEVAEPETVDEAIDAVEEPIAIEEPVALEAPIEEPVAVEGIAEVVEQPVAVDEIEPVEAIDDSQAEQPEQAVEAPRAGFSKLLEGFANLTGFYGQSVNIDPAVPIEEPVEEMAAEEPHVVEEQPVEPDAVEHQEAAIEPLAASEPVAEIPEEAALEEPAAEPEANERALDDIAPDDSAEPSTETAEPPAPEIAEASAPEPETIPQAAPAMEGSLKSKLDEVQAKADEAREAQLRATKALHEGLSAAYDFALDAEGSPEEYLRLVEAQGLKIQLRAPMAPVAKLAFDGVCDAATIRQFESVLAWALKVELPRGALLERIEQAGGIPELLNEFAKAA